MDLMTNTDSSAATTQGATDLLRADHKQVRELIAQYREARNDSSTSRNVFVEDTCMRLELHGRVEEEVFYPAVAKLAPEIVSHALQEHADMKKTIGSMKAAQSDDPQYDRMFSELASLAERHMDEEERVLFPRVEAELQDRLQSLGQEIKTKKEQLVGSTDELEGRS